MSSDNSKGIVDATNRIFRVLLKKPAFKNNVRSLLNSIDSDNARDLAKTVIWEDPEIVLSLVGAIPCLANTLIKFMDEVMVQMMEKFPPELLKEFIGSIIREIDTDTVKRIRDNLSTMIDEGYFQYDPEGLKKEGANSGRD
jgi:hypothetical protein